MNHEKRTHKNEQMKEKVHILFPFYNWIPSTMMQNMKIMQMVGPKRKKKSPK